MQITMKSYLSLAASIGVGAPVGIGGLGCGAGKTASSIVWTTVISSIYTLLVFPHLALLSFLSP